MGLRKNVGGGRAGLPGEGEAALALNVKALIPRELRVRFGGKVKTRGGPAMEEAGMGYKNKVDDGGACCAGKM